MNFTEGKWKVTQWSSHNHLHISADDGNNLTFVADCGNLEEKFGLPYNPDVIANAKLIAAAPEMLRALIEARLQIEYLHDKFKETGTGNAILARIESVIANAEVK